LYPIFLSIVYLAYDTIFPVFRKNTVVRESYCLILCTVLFVVYWLINTIFHFSIARSDLNYYCCNLWHTKFSFYFTVKRFSFCNLLNVLIIFCLIRCNMYFYVPVSCGKIKIKLWMKHLKEKCLKNFLTHRLKKLSENSPSSIQNIKINLTRTSNQRIFVCET